MTAGTDWKVFLDKLSGRFSECMVLVVVVSPALFLSKPCLEEIYNALEAKVWILPILFEGPIPPVRDQWPMITKADSDKNKLMLNKVTTEFSNLNIVPAPPGTVLLQPEALIQAIADVVSRVSAPEPEAEEAEPSTEVTEHESGYEEAVSSLLVAFTGAGMTDPAKLVALLEENGIGSTEEFYSLDQDDAAEILDLAKAAKVVLGDRNKFKSLLDSFG